MKVGTDGVLLGAWSEPKNANSILDIGTGTGLIALMLAQRSTAQIVGIEIDESAAKQAKENVERSSWEKRIEMAHSRFQDFAIKTETKFDLIVSNPPFFVDSLHTPTASRSVARHAAELSHHEILQHSLHLLSNEGKLNLILPVAEGLKCIEMARGLGLFCHKMTSVYPRVGHEAKRLLLSFGVKVQECTQNNLTIETDERHVYTAEFIELTKDYYLKF